MVRGVGDGVGNYDWQINVQCFKFFFYCKYCCFGVEGVEDGFNQDQVCFVFYQCFGGFMVGCYQLIEGDIMKCWVVDVW